MNKDEIIDEYVRQVTLKIDVMPNAFAKTTVSDRKHMDNGFRYAIMASIEVLKVILEEKKENAFRTFVNKQLGLTPPTQKDIDDERAKLALEQERLKLAKIRAEMSELKKTGGASPFGDFIKHGIEYNPLSTDKKKKEDDE